MATIVINGSTYKIPAHIVERNATYADDHYGQQFLKEVITGAEDFDRIDSENGDWLESQCFAAYAKHFNIDEGAADISEVKNSVFGWFSDYDEEDWDLYLLEKA